MAYTLSRCSDWKVFATLTWDGVTPPPSTSQRKLLFAHLFRIARFQKIPFRRLLWVVRQEYGEKTFRPHYHVLFGWRGPRANIGQMFTLNSFWTKLPKAGFARHFVYNPGKDAVGYIMKGLSGCLPEQRLEASNYEAAKFGWSENEVTLGEAFIRLIGRSMNRRLGAEGPTGHSDKSKPETYSTKTNRERPQVFRSEPDLQSIVHRPGNWAGRRWI